MIFSWVGSCLGDFVELQRGTTYKSSLLGLPGPFLLGLASIQPNGGFRESSLRTYGGESAAKLILKPGDIYVSLKDVTQSADLLGAVSQVPPQIAAGRLTQDTVKLTFKNNKVPSNFIYWLLRTPEYREYCRAHSMGTTNLSLSRSDFLAYAVPEPTARRRALVTLLESTESKINLNRQTNRTLELMAQSLFQAWFVDFEPVKAKVAALAEGRDPRRAAMCTLSGRMDDELDEMPREAFDALAATAALFPEEMEESALGAIPKGWKVSTVEELSSKVGMGPFGSNIKVSTFVETGIPVISGPHVKSLQLQDGETKFVSVQHADRLASANVQRGDVIFTHAGNISNVSYIPDGSRYERYILSQRQFFLRVDSHKISPIYIVYFFNSPEGQHKLLANSSSSGVPSIARPVSYLKSITLPTPTKAIFCLFDTVIRHYHRMIMNKRQETETLESLRDSLLPKLLSGELAVTPEEADT